VNDIPRERACVASDSQLILSPVQEGAKSAEKAIHYKRSRFTTHLPADYLYTPSHAWLAPQPDGVWRVGITKFAARMLGEMVDHGWEVAPGAGVACGQVIGWLEGFKAITDIFCVLDGNLTAVNIVLKEKITLVNKDCYGQGWLYDARGQPDARCLDVHAYAKLLDKTIDKILEKQKAEEIT
jgi:glycine cleavage system H protein